ncbi:hypothetical protein RCL1_003704 [Eukaryota sp. TZLM3-RCL]
MSDPETAVSTDNVLICDTPSSKDFRFAISPTFLISAKKSETDMVSITSSAKEFYLKQNEEVDILLDAHQVCVTNQPSNSDDDDDKGGLITSKLSLIANVVLLGIKVFVFYMSGSLSIFASVLDSLLDLVSGSILAVTTRISKKRDYLRYPAGKSRAEPLGVIVFATLMGIVAVQVIVEAVSKLLATGVVIEFNYLDLALMAAVILTKLLLFLYCKRYASKSSAAKALAQDHKNDVLTNGFGTICAYLAAQFYVWIDPVGAILFSLYILVNWIITLFEQMSVMMGVVASPEIVKKVILMALNHDPRITSLCTVRAFHFGSGVFVEVDIVLPSTMILEEAHEIGESLQNKIEKLADVERAFVHIDTNSHHSIADEHRI